MEQNDKKKERHVRNWPVIKTNEHPEIKERFSQACFENGKNESIVLRELVRGYLRENEIKQ